MKSRVFSIEEFSVYDGPGIRTTIFFKGCPLNCNWCHSPEGKSFANQTVRSPNGCIHCNKCIDICPNHREKCDACGKCIDVCPRNLIRMSSYDIENIDLFKKVEKNFDVLRMNDGGITLSGGEPLFQANSLLEFISLCKGKTHIAIQTSGYGNSEIFKKIINSVDLVLFDMKIVDEQEAFKYEGINNSLIFKNLEILKKSNTKFIARIPLIPGLIDTEKNVLAIIEKLKDAENLICVEELPYNKYAGSKYAMIEKKYEPMFDESTPSNPRVELFEKNGIKVRIL